MDLTQLFLFAMTVMTAVMVLFNPQQTQTNGDLMYSLAAYQSDETHSPAYEHVKFYQATYMLEELPPVPVEYPMSLAAVSEPNHQPESSDHDVPR